MNRLASIRRMALAAAACAFIDVPWRKPERTEVPSGDGWTLARAINEALPGDVIYIAPGRYEVAEPLYWRNGVSLHMRDSVIAATHDGSEGAILTIERDAQGLCAGNLFKFERDVWPEIAIGLRWT